LDSKKNKVANQESVINKNIKTQI